MAETAAPHIAPGVRPGLRVVVTAGAAGIGRAIADTFVAHGAKVVVSDIDETALADFQGAHPGHPAHRCDAGNGAEVERFMAAALDHLGGLDVLVNNAGIAIGAIPAEGMSDSDWHRVLDVNLHGVFYCCRSFGQGMLTAGGGAIVNVGSMSGDIVNRPQEQAQYNASKAAVHHLTRSLAVEWAGRGVRVNAVAPTYVETELTRFGLADPALADVWVDMTPMRRVGRPDEIAAVILFLASDAASLMTGAIVTADAGYTCF